MRTTQKYLDKLSRVAGTQEGAARIARLTHVLGADTSNPVSRYLAAHAVDSKPVIEDGLGTVLGAAGGAFLGYRRKHPWLGVISGASVGRNMPALFNPDLRKDALVNMGQTGVAVAASLVSPSHPAAAFVVAWLGAGAAIYFGKIR